MKPLVTVAGLKLEVSRRQKSDVNDGLIHAAQFVMKHDLDHLLFAPCRAHFLDKQKSIISSMINAYTNLHHGGDHWVIESTIGIQHLTV